MTEDEYIRTRAQYMADSVDARIFLLLTEGEPTSERLSAFLRDEGWAGRKYAVDYFRTDTVPEFD